MQTSAKVLPVALLLIFGLTACNKFRSAEKFIADAKSYEQKGDHKAAVIQLKNALQKDPNNSSARLLLGTIYIETGEAASAENELRKAASLGVKKDQVLPLLAKSLLLQSQFKKVLSETDQATNLNADPDMLTMRGNALLGLRQYSEAKDAYELALKAQADYPAALIGLSKQAYFEKDIAGANKYADLATSKNSKSIEAWIFKGDLLRMQSQPDLALLAYGEALKLQADNSTALIEKANVEISMKKFAEAQADILAAKKANPGNLVAIYTQALLDFSQGKNKEALESLQQVQKSAPKYMPAILLTGAVQFALGSTKQSEVYLQKYLEGNPGSVYAQKMLAASQLKNGQADKALETLDATLKDDSIQDNQLFAIAGDAATRTRNYTKANEYFEKAIALAPENANYHSALAVSKLSMGDNDRAISELETATTLNNKSSSSSKSGVLLVMTYMHLQDFDKALTTIKALEKDQPENPMLKNLTGGIYLNKNDKANARANFEKALALQPTYFPASFNLASMDIREKKFDEAKKRIMSMLSKDNKNLQVNLALAGLAQLQGNKEETKKWLEKAHEEHPESLQAAQILITYYLGTQDKQKALTMAKNLQTSNPENRGYLNLLAQTQEMADDKQGAVASFTMLAALRPNSPDEQFRVAVAYISIGKETEAIDALKKTLRLDPKFLKAQIAMAGIQTKHGDFELALQFAQQVQKQSPKGPEGYVMEGDILMAKKKPELAVKAYETAYNLSKHGPMLVKLHYALVQNGKDKEADAKVLQWLKDNPTDLSTRLYLAIYWLGSQKSKLPAIEQFQIILKNDPNNLVALNNLAWAYDQEKNPQALQYAEKSYQIAAGNPQILDTYGWILVEKGEVARGLPMLQQAAKIIPAESEVRYHLAFALAKSGEKDKARKELEQITAGKDFPNMKEAKSLLVQMSL
ncbi:XrtA/PEP-CTERM system TPR-repeat protein PrsT [Solimicrobium silvestre]|uniref:XrtA/PEP-CTERM system TPR-repeat protein PrsT n=1 Tax=Solimicrobium silvestre TaxID=2099400 RepID=UPI001A9C6D6E|nr:XrtA/PEP-CTERM system TPR-repeat protein PrsT [Solimicrobium silvestre]